MNDANLQIILENEIIDRKLNIRNYVFSYYVLFHDALLLESIKMITSAKQMCEKFLIYDMIISYHRHIAFLLEELYFMCKLPGTKPSLLIHEFSYKMNSIRTNINKMYGRFATGNMIHQKLTEHILSLNEINDSQLLLLEMIIKYHFTVFNTNFDLMTLLINARTNEFLTFIWNEKTKIYCVNLD
jgi:hypothetical protein